MNFSWGLFSNLLLAHLVSDFFLQTQKMVDNKNSRHMFGSAIYKHVVIVTLLSCVAVGSVDFLPYALLIGGTHWVIDLAKVRFKKHPLWPFVIDQMCHLMILAWVTARFQTGWEQWALIPLNIAASLPLICAALVFLTTPSNILIREVFDLQKAPLEDFMIKVPKSEKDALPRLKDVGALIGTLERCLTFVFVLNGNYQAVGFIVAAKSILRFRESEGARAEYVLVGTLLSFSIAVLCALAVLWIKHEYL